MVRSLRIQYPGAYYHVTCRGNERQKIYRDDTDYNIFIKAVSKSQIAFKNKARSDEKAEHTSAYVSILRMTATPLLDVRWGF